MAVPEGYTEVGLIGLVNKGNYDPLTEYSKYNFVYYQGSTYLYINELPQSGVTPSDDGVTWQYMSRGMIMDNTPTQGSPNAVTSGGIYDSERALKTEIQNEQTAATTKATDTNNVLGQGTVTNATNVQALLDNVTDKDTNPTKDSAKTVTSGGVYSSDKATREMIAPVEENATSSAPYAIGEQLIFNGVLCEATSAISIGDTLAMGTNLSTANKITNRDSTPTANSTKLVTSGGVYSADNQIRENIANVEGATSAHPYTVGKQLIFNGLLCKATSAISVGDTLAVGTNLALSDNVVEQIYSLNQGLSNSLADMNNVLGAKNLLPNNAESQTVNGVTFKVNSDGSITANGTATSQINIYMIDNPYSYTLKANKYVLSGCPLGGDASNGYFLRLTLIDNGSDIQYDDIGNGVEINVLQDYRIKDSFICIRSGVTVSNLTFYPMLRPASIQDNTYVPYSMTNREMTHYVQSISNPNLLDNPWFTVNQRGQNVYTSEGYTVDRWRLSYGTGATTHQATVNNDNSITIECEGTNNVYFGQKLENELLSGNDYTVSIKCRNIIGSPNFQISYSDGTYGSTHIVTRPLDTYTILNLSKNSKGIIFNIHPGESITLEAVKIEKGSVSTLSMDSAPNYQQELAKCQRYFFNANMANTNFSEIGYGFYDNDYHFVNVPTPVPMRKTPTVSMGGTVRAFIDGTRYFISDYSISVSGKNDTSIKIAIHKSDSNLPVYSLGAYSFDNINGLLMFSADL